MIRESIGFILKWSEMILPAHVSFNLAREAVVWSVLNNTEGLKLLSETIGQR